MHNKLKKMKFLSISSPVLGFVLEQESIKCVYIDRFRQIFSSHCFVCQLTFTIMQHKILYCKLLWVFHFMTSADSCFTASLDIVSLYYIALLPLAQHEVCFIPSTVPHRIPIPFFLKNSYE